MPHLVQLGISKWPAKEHAKNCYCSYIRWKKAASFIVPHYEPEEVNPDQLHQVGQFKSNRIWSFRHWVMLPPLLWLLSSHWLKRFAAAFNVTLLEKVTLSGHHWCITKENELWSESPSRPFRLQPEFKHILPKKYIQWYFSLYFTSLSDYYKLTEKQKFYACVQHAFLQIIDMEISSYQ